MTNVKPKAAAAATLLGLGGLAGYALSSSAEVGQHPAAASGSQPVEVRTQVIRRKVHVIRHERPKHPKRAAGTPGRNQRAASGSRSAATSVASAGAPPSGARTYAAPASQPVAVSRPAPTRRPVTTRSSGAGNGAAGGHGDDGGEHEHEGGDD